MPRSIEEAVFNAKLTDLDIIEIRQSALTTAEVAKKYQVTRRTIYLIQKRLSWAHIS